jgi:hypothetical protein
MVGHESRSLSGTIMKMEMEMEMKMKTKSQLLLEPKDDTR